MNNQLLQCLNNSKLLLMHAKNSNWDKFEILHPHWTKEVDVCLAENTNKPMSKNVSLSIQSLIEDVDNIQILIKRQMSKIEKDLLNLIKRNKSVKKYLK